MEFWWRERGIRPYFSARLGCQKVSKCAGIDHEQGGLGDGVAGQSSSLAAQSSLISKELPRSEPNDGLVCAMAMPATLRRWRCRLRRVSIAEMPKV